MADAAVEFQALANALREAGETGLKNELYKAISDAAQPLAADIQNLTHLRALMPDRYADVFASSLKVSTYKRPTGTEPGVTLVAKAPTAGRGGRKVRQRDLGNLVHPIFATGPRTSWRWVTPDDGRKGITPGFFSGPVAKAGPAVRDQIEQAIKRVRDKIYAAR